MGALAAILLGECKNDKCTVIHLSVCQSMEGVLSKACGVTSAVNL